MMTMKGTDKSCQSKHLRVATRRSELALAQTRQLMDRMMDVLPGWGYELVEIDSAGDLDPERRLSSFGGKGVFSKTLEQALLDDRADLAVHSLKDLTVDMDPVFALPVLSEREDPADVLVLPRDTSLDQLGPGSVVGTGSPRRALQLEAWHPCWEVRSIRGNVTTRLEKLAQGEYDAIVLAASGLRRLEFFQSMKDRFSFIRLDVDQMIPACGQGILAVQTLASRHELNELLAKAGDDALSRFCYEAERAVIRHLGASCQAPVAAHCWADGSEIRLSAINGLGGRHFVKRVDEVICRVGTREEIGPLLSGLLNQLSGKVWLVGAGPGDPGLFTLKGKALLETADVVVYDRLGTKELEGMMAPSAERIYVGKVAGDHAMKQKDICALLVKKALEGKKVVRLKGGDPFVFGRGGEELLILKEASIPFEVVPGVTSAVSAPAYAGIPVTHRGLASSVHFITAHEGEGGKSDALDYQMLAGMEGTLVFMMGVGNLEHIANGLIEAGKDPSTPAAMVSNGTLARQREIYTCLKDLVADRERHRIDPPAVIVIGEVAGLGPELSWFHDGRLASTVGQEVASGLVSNAGLEHVGGRSTSTGAEEGEESQRSMNARNEVSAPRRILITRSKPPRTAHDRSLMVERSLEAGLVPIEASLIRIDPDPALQQQLDDGLRAAFSDGCPGGRRWLVLTSAHGVDHFFDSVKRLDLDLRELAAWRFAVIGSATAAALHAYGYRADLMPAVFDSEHLAEALIKTVGPTDHVVAVRAEIASPVLARELDRAGIRFTALTAYRTLPDEASIHELPELLKQVDGVTFSSSSAVHAFMKGLKRAGLCPEALSDEGLTIFAIGPVTADTCREQGLGEPVVAETYTVDGLVQAIVSYYSTDQT